LAFTALHFTVVAAQYDELQQLVKVLVEQTYDMGSAVQKRRNPPRKSLILMCQSCARKTNKHEKPRARFVFVLNIDRKYKNRKSFYYSDFVFVIKKYFQKNDHDEENQQYH